MVLTKREIRKAAACENIARQEQRIQDARREGNKVANVALKSKAEEPEMVSCFPLFDEGFCIESRVLKLTGLLQ